jgi:hypothetical protein
VYTKGSFCVHERSRAPASVRPRARGSSGTVDEEAHPKAPLVFALRLQPRVHRFALHGKDAEDTFMNAMQRLVAHEPLKPFDAERELTLG